ncbi:hypothetical protein D9611_008186 [Ephemerocybe angulata]|uniref:Uncharacterized protein n=1 Tax=Ephemerocybe angulata TaxID=980116 RepID=A0A8H5BYX6_9AGAR|nr:hypothetical protein D9611_008186 [Tulosesus angulatus]
MLTPISILYSVLMMHTHEEYWGPDAAQFNPDRFLDERKKSSDLPSDHHGLTPGHGAATRTRTGANPTRETAGLPAKTNPKTAKSDEIWLRYGSFMS